MPHSNHHPGLPAPWDMFGTFCSASLNPKWCSYLDPSPPCIPAYCYKFSTSCTMSLTPKSAYTSIQPPPKPIPCCLNIRTDIELQIPLSWTQNHALTLLHYHPVWPASLDRFGTLHPALLDPKLGMEFTPNHTLGYLQPVTYLELPAPHHQSPKHGLLQASCISTCMVGTNILTREENRYMNR